MAEKMELACASSPSDTGPEPAWHSTSASMPSPSSTALIITRTSSRGAAPPDSPLSGGSSAGSSAGSRTQSTPETGWYSEDAEWNRYKNEIVRLYWEEDLPTRRVQEIMICKHGFNKSVKMYKYRFKRWGIRKNIKKQEALELAARQNQASSFWPATRGSTYQHRIARHLRQKKADKSPLPRRWMESQLLAPVALPGRMRGPDLFEAFEKAFYSADVYLAKVAEARHSDWFTKPPALEFGEHFFDLFVQGMENLSRNLCPQETFTTLNNAFENLKGLIATDHPMIYYRIASRVASCKVYPSSEICTKLCRLLADYCFQMTRVIHGDNHPLAFWWAVQIRVLESGDLSLLDNFLEVSRMVSGKHLVAGKGLVHVAAYVPSAARDQDEQSLRGTVAERSRDMNCISEVQEARLALVELLLGEERGSEAHPILEEAISLKHLDPQRPSSKTFWISELLWRAGFLNRSISVLRETVDLIKVEEDLAPCRPDQELNYVSVLHVLRSKLEWLRWEEELRQVNDKLAPLMSLRETPLKIRFVSSDLEMDPDLRYNTSVSSPADTATPSPPAAPPSMPIRLAPRNASVPGKTQSEHAQCE
ncbi:hypothetical protein BD289DRAFT_69425 [Coniella lustricola]|uniref:Clr5 domain-containing protein n=1 Tax=Coniella lustricola TaxID=2025994 RepID=A0A2T3A010_9PEZI|nr:hypothetical protein BD289DRAFT_69425 [Coniella lustricola]